LTAAGVIAYDRAMPAVPPDPGAMAVKLGAQVARAVWPVGVKVRDQVDAHRQIGEMLPRVLRLTFCPSGSRDGSLGRAVELAAERLHAVALPQQRQRKPPGRLKRLGTTVRDRIPLRRAPPVALFGQRDFDELLTAWMADALTDTRLLGHIERIECPDHVEPHPAVISARFAAAFFKVLYAEADESRYRTLLLQSLRQADENRAWAKPRLDAVDRVLNGTLGAGITAVVTGGAAELAGASDATTATVALAGAVTAFAMTSTSDRWATRNAKPRLDADVRKAVGGMLRDWAQGEDSSDPPAGDVRSVTERLITAWSDVAPHDPASMSRRVAYLRDAALQAGDGRLAASLLVLGDALLAGERGCAARERALRDVADCVT
jgi:hypothetical protein